MTAMYELILIILIVALAAVAFNMQARFETRLKRDEKRTQMIEELRARHEDLRTVDLIGEKAYHDMTDRIDRILREHCHQQCLTLEMTCGPDNRCCAEELHKLLPGDELCLEPCRESGVEWIDVYSNGMRIGRLALLEAGAVRDTMKSNHIRGVYVAEQNCYGIEDSHKISLIMFYEPKEKIASGGLQSTTSEGYTEGRADNTRRFCQN